MSNRQYRLLFGALLLTALYFEQTIIIYFLISLAIFEAITNLRLPIIISRLRYEHDGDPTEGEIGINFTVRSGFEAERGWRLTVATMIFLSIFIFPEALWFIPWFMGVAILGAGVSGVCPMYLVIKWIGLK